ncbi:V-type ATPase subunit [Candidatus Enterococcus courvalinii]|uniref:V-type ATPase subunit n=1 Tax=Candidatus Enterococcus courvalinii TaxID=2815329 RepID=A0ABS3HYN5_9ENTE|nr:V-type ATPase subunit [Enterococcus sp. MSG2901]MBO0481577.1 V-type ATPase subunit [Enterococcus sp. MSG2901]
MNYHELNPLIRGRELELLTNEDFERLIQAPSIDSFGEQLKTTIYQPYVYEGFEYELEQNLAKEQSELFAWLKERVPEPEILWIYTMRFTFHNLKVLTKAELTGKNLDHLFIDDGFYSLDKMKEAIRTQDSIELPETLLASIREVFDYFEGATILQGIDVIYDRHFLTEQRRLGEKLGYKELLTEIIALIDLTNITTMARGLIQGRTKGFMTTVLSSAGGIEKEIFLSFIGQELEVYNRFLLTTDYAEIIRPALKETKIDLITLERLKDDYLSSLYQEAQTQAFGPLPLLAFLNAKEVERKNLRLLAVGKRSQFSAEQIRERVRTVYGA